MIGNNERDIQHSVKGCDMKARAIIISALTICAVTGACGSGNDTSSAEPDAYPKLAASAVEEVKWYDDWNEGMAAAKKADKPVLVHFTADWCVYCRKMKKETYSAPEIKQRFNDGWITIMIDTENKEGSGTVYVDEGEKKALAYLDDDQGSFEEKKYGHGELLQFFGGMGLPTLLFIDKQGAPLQKISSFLPPEDLAVILDYFQQEAYNTTSFEDFKKQAEKKG